MIAKCIFNRGADLGGPVRNGYLETTEFTTLTVGKKYEVFGIGMWGTSISILICDDSDKPAWDPIGLFDIVEQKLPSHWLFAVYDGPGASGKGACEYGWMIRWGYPELVRNPDHSDGLMERVPAEMQKFYEEMLRPRDEFL